MAYNDKTWPIQRHAFGDARSRGGSRHILELSFGYTQMHRRASSTPTLIAATGVSNSVVTELLAASSTVSPVIPDVPRAVALTFGGTAASIAATACTVTGVNIEGKVITDTITPTATTAGTYNGTKAFRRITSVSIPIQGGTGVTVALVARDVFGLFHRLPSGTAAANVRVVSTSNVTNLVLTSGSSTTSNLGANGIKTLQAAPTTLNVDPTNVESNTFVPATAVNGNTHLTVYYYYVKWNLDPVNDLTKSGNQTTYYGVSR